MAELNTMDVSQLNSELNDAQGSIKDLTKEYGVIVNELDKQQSLRMDAQRKENETKNKLKIIKSNIAYERERLRSIKTLLKAEASGLV